MLVAPQISECFGLTVTWSDVFCLGPWLLLAWTHFIPLAPLLTWLLLPWSTLICLGLVGLFQITIEWLCMLEPISGIGLDGMEISVCIDSNSTSAVLIIMSSQYYDDECIFNVFGYI